MYRRLTKYMISNFFEDNFFCEENSCYTLEELDEAGRSVLNLDVGTSPNLCISNIDEKNTKVLFFRYKDIAGNDTHLFKRVDHIIFVFDENENKWNVHLFEMKTGVENMEKWYSIKGKFRASYIVARALASMLHFEIGRTTMYTTFEHASLLEPSKSNPVLRRQKVGVKPIDICKEWDGSDFGLNFDQRINFMHIPIKMIRNNEGVLEGVYQI